MAQRLVRFRFSMCVLFMVLMQGLSAYELGIVMMFKNEARHLREWVEYHRLVGVEHFWLYNNLSSDNWKEVLDPYIKEGVVEVFDWNDPNWPSCQVQAFANGLQKARGKTKWVAVIDMDEFVLPLVEKTIPKCLKKHFSGANAVYVNWRCFGTSRITLPKNKPFLFKLTSCSLPTHPHNAVGKSIVQPDKVRLDTVWTQHFFPLNPGYVYVNGSNTPMEFTREIDLEPDGKHHDNFIRINHYILRDDDYFYNVRMRTTDAGRKALLLEQYESFSLTDDKKILEYLLKNHPKECKRIWHVKSKKGP
jgi:hypothetical protein